MNQIAKEEGMSYFLAWANFSDTNFYVPYKNGDKGQELINEFIDFYNEDSSIFANGTNFYSKAANRNVTDNNPGNPGGYFTNVFSKDVIMEGKVLSANVRNASKVEFVLQNGDKTETLTAKNNGTGYEAEVTKETLDALGLTDVGTLSLVADGKILSVLTFMCFGKEKDILPENVIDAIVKKGETLQLKAVVTPANAKKAGLSWSSSDRKIAVVDSKGKVKGKKYGRMTITAKAKDGSGVKATCKLTVGYGITYKLNKGKNNSENPTVYYNEKVKLRKPSHKGYVFKGWYTDEKFKKKITVIKKGTKKNYTLYAKWKKSK